VIASENEVARKKRTKSCGKVTASGSWGEEESKAIGPELRDPPGTPLEHAGIA
jgi:hypothetical protein